MKINKISNIKENKNYQLVLEIDLAKNNRKYIINPNKKWNKKENMNSKTEQTVNKNYSRILTQVY